MMDERKGSIFGLNNSGGFGNVNPYLNVDPTYLQAQTPEFLVNPEIERGRLENSFTAIGAALFVGGASGGTVGLYDAIRNTALSDSSTGFFKGVISSKIARTRALNSIIKSCKLL